MEDWRASAKGVNSSLSLTAGAAGPRLFTIHQIDANTNNLPKAHTWWVPPVCWRTRSRKSILLNLSFLFSFNRIDIPPYEGYDKLYDKLLTAIEETCGFAVEWDALRSIRAACSLPLLSFMLFPLLFDQLLLHSFSTHFFVVVVVFQGQIQNKTWVSRVCIQNNKVLNHLISSQFIKQVSVSFNFFFFFFFFPVESASLAVELILCYWILNTAGSHFLPLVTNQTSRYCHPSDYRVQNA